MSDSRKAQILAMALGLSQFGFMVSGGLLLGFWVDKQIGTTPWLGFLGLFAGFGSGLHLLMRLVKKARGGD